MIITTDMFTKFTKMSKDYSNQSICCTDESVLHKQFLLSQQQNKTKV